MDIKRFLTLSLFVLTVVIFGKSMASDGKHPIVHMKTNMGEIVLKLDAEKAPKTVKNFLMYVKDGYYNGTIFHRVIENFMIQGGGFDGKLSKKETKGEIKNEADNGLKNNRGTIAMARTNAPHSASAQFFINTVDNGFLNFSSATPRGWGYAVFGKVISGMDVVDAIRKVPTGAKRPFRSDVPKKTVTIEKMTLAK